MVEQEDAVRDAHAALHRHARAAAGRDLDPLRRRPRLRPWCRIWPAACPAAACGWTPNRQVLARALARNQFAKAARGAGVGAAPIWSTRSQAMLAAPLPRSGRPGAARRRAGGRLRPGRGLAAARRAAALVLTASDGAADGRRRIEALAGGVPVLDPFDRAELGGAVGRDGGRPCRHSPIAASPASCSTSSGGCTDFESSACPSGMPSATQ